jgi:hypothetical protein
MYIPKIPEIENSFNSGWIIESYSDLQADTPEKTETITFRLPISIIKGLKRDAQFEGVSANTLAIRVFSNHLLWEKYERKVGLLPMTKSFLENVIEKMTDQEIMNLAEKIEKETFKSILVFMKRERSKEEFVRILRTWLSVSWMQHSLELRDDGNYYFTIRHELGKNWSLYIKTLVSELYHDSFSDKIQIDTTSSTISIVLPS